MDTTQTTTHGRTLADLIRQRQDTTGDSYATIANRGGLSKAKIGQLATITQPHMPRADTLERLAAGLELPFRIVQQAAMVTAGVTPENTDPDADLGPLVARLRQLTDDDRDTVELIVGAMYSRRHA